MAVQRSSFWLFILRVSAVDWILEGRSRLFVERVLVRVPSRVEAVLLELSVLPSIIDDGEQLPQQEEEQAKENYSRNHYQDDHEDRQGSWAVLLLLHPHSQVVVAVVVVEEVEGAVVAGVDELAVVRVVTIGDIQHRELLDRNHLERAFLALRLVVGSGAPLLAHDARLILDALGWTGRAYVAERSAVFLPFLVSEAVAFPAYALAVPSTHLSILRNAGLCAYGALTSWSRPAGIALTYSTDACPVTSTELAVVTGAVEVVAFAELATHNLLRIRSGEATAHATLAHSPP